MAKEKSSASDMDPFKAPAENALELAIEAATTVNGANPKAAVNAILIEEAKDGVRYKNGRTMPMSAKRLMAAARLKSIRPSFILSDNLVASGETRPDNVAAHHIVAAGDRRATRSQKRLFGWHIAINDVDNGVYLPKYKSTVVESLPKAIKHAGLHTSLYHLEVFARLRLVPAEFDHRERGRESLRTIRKELLDGTFPYRQEAGGMTVWELRNANVNDFAVLVLPVEDEDIDEDKVFGGTGVSLKWRRKRALEVFLDKGRKKPKPRADVSAFLPGALVLNQRAVDALGAFLEAFGQMLPLVVDGQPEYFFNVTNIVRCVDIGRSQKRPEGTIAKEAFDESAIPAAAAVFKDPSTAPVRIYVNAEARKTLEALIARAGLSGVEMVAVGI